MARGIGILAPDAGTARERFLAEAPDREVIDVVPLDISDIPLRVPFDEPYWAVAFEDPDPDKFIQDADPIAKATRDVREGLQTMVADPEALTTGMVEGNVPCPGCGETVHLDLPPDDLVRRPDFGPLLQARCPECRRSWSGRRAPVGSTGGSGPRPRSRCLPVDRHPSAAGAVSGGHVSSVGPKIGRSPRSTCGRNGWPATSNPLADRPTASRASSPRRRDG
jgi:hypothetical protein